MMKSRKLSSRYHFNNIFSFVLTAITLVLLVVLSILYDDNKTNSSISSDAVLSNRLVHRWLEDIKDDNNSGDDGDGDDDDYSSISCSYIYDQVPEAGNSQCIFARTCNDGQGVWAPWVFCSSSMGVYAAFAVLSPIVILWMITLFRLLGSTAEDFFSCSLEMFSLKLGLPPRFAGVTLLALGNGAADVSSTISAITSDEENGYKLSLGALTGAAMLVGGVVSGIVVLVADGVPCRGALIRDVTALLVTIGIVCMYLSGGIVTRSITTIFLGMYCFFVCLVLAADVYHRTVVLPRLAAVAATINIERAGINDNALELNEDTTGEGPLSNAFMRFVTAVSNYDNSYLNNDTGGVTTTTMTTAAQQGLGPTQVTQSEMLTPTADDVASATDNFDEEPIILHGQKGILSGDGHVVTSNLEMETAEDDLGDYTLVEDHIDRVCVGEGSLGIPPHSWSGALQNGRQEVTNELIELWGEISNKEGDLKIYERVLLFFELPFTVLRKATIPIPCEGYYNKGFVVLSLILSPLWFVYYLSVEHDLNLFSKAYFPYFMIYFGVSTLIGCLVLRLAPDGDGNMSLITATPIAFYGFIMAATWIDYTADHLVALLEFLGIVLRIPGSIMGLTILAWGNSVGDLSANITMARKGLANMAMTACFAGPVFNILLGLGLGFRSLETKTGKEESVVSLSAPIVSGFIFIAVNCITILVIGCFIGKGRIETYYGYVAVTLYAIYVITSITLEFRN